MKDEEVIFAQPKVHAGIPYVHELGGIEVMKVSAVGLILKFRIWVRVNTLKTLISTLPRSQLILGTTRFFMKTSKYMII
jgi:hypothetical protein